MSIFAIPKLYVKFWWPLFLAINLAFLFLDLAKIQISIPKSAYGGGSTGFGIISKKNSFFTASLMLIHAVFACRLVLNKAAC